MVKAATVAGLLAVATMHFACSPFGGSSAFTCTQDADCQGGAQIGGRCELSTGFCAFPDDACGPAGRYGDLAGGLSNQCVGGELPTDGGVDGEPDGNPDDVCFGAAGGLENPCWAPGDVPDQAVTISAATAIDTTDSPMCSSTVNNSTACVIAGSAITISGGVTLRATGTKPLVLVATNGSIQVSGIIDVASHVTALADVGAGGNDAGCDAGTAANTSSGGAGGSHGALGGNGGGGVNVPANGGDPGAATGAITTLRGGCRGQDGKEGTNGAATRGIGGNGGGAVYLIATTSVTVAANATINASGSGGTTGISGSAGGGAGGSGGTIGIDAPTLTNGGQIFAHGGGGGPGSGLQTGGTNGADPSFTVANGGTSNNGGAGGTGGIANTGGNGANSLDRGGGGAGGGTGIIRLFGGAAAGGQISPTPI